MTEQQKKLQELIENVVIPDIEDHIDDILTLIAKDKVLDDAKESELNSINEMKDEFKAILNELANNELDDQECVELYDEIMDMISE
ncbi:MAG: hypothetical protein IE909_18215 [Campylobacterales bacterium]|nr:hypothetical protein [Campylobacterales bacterium]